MGCAVAVDVGNAALGLPVTVVVLVARARAARYGPVSSESAGGPEPAESDVLAAFDA